MGSLFRSETSGIMRRYLYTMSGGESSISGPDENGHTLTYYDGTYVLVWTNGSLLTWNDEYETPNGSSVDLLGGRTFDSGDEVVIAAFDAFAIADHYTKQEVDNDFVKKADGLEFPVKAWVKFNGNDGSVYDSYNVSDVTRNQGGDYTVSFENELPDSNYVVSGSVPHEVGGRVVSVVCLKDGGTMSTSSVDIITAEGSTDSYNGRKHDKDPITVMFVR